MYMKSETLVIGALLFFSSICFSFEKNGRLFLHRESNGYDESIWWVSTNKVNSLPKWIPESKDSPITIKKAVDIARNWSNTHGPYHSKGRTEQIVICSAQPGYGNYHDVFFYRILLQVGPWGNFMTCVVLMDGTVVEPEVNALENKTTVQTNSLRGANENKR